ncbi:TadE/TadG family type IV pilus assembly protein [Streptomyces sp. NPDC056161]|uniref:TadE/TadG family type IV pilus assembly protein n=1 Tax=Streptomyces sp. NPDC056161 TaxID=3345732 RepID=UPI0035DF3372
MSGGDGDVGTGLRSGLRAGGHRVRRRSHRSPRRRDRGQVAIEYLGFIPVLLIVALAGIQTGLVAYTAQQAGTAARAGARAASLRQDVGRACTAAVSDWLAGGTRCATAELGDSVEVTATVHIPTVVFGWNFGDARKSATMPLDH